MPEIAKTEEIVKRVLAGMQSRPAKISLSQAKIIAEAVEQEAARVGVKAVVAISDGAGRPVLIHCTDGAFMGSFDVALNKTYTAVAFQMSTEALGKLAQPGESLYGIQFTNEGKIVIFGGGEPIYAHGELVGAIGVSGGTAEQDTGLGAFGKSFAEHLLNE